MMPWGRFCDTGPELCKNEKRVADIERDKETKTDKFVAIGTQFS